MKKPIALIITDTHEKESNIEVNKSVFKQACVLAKELKLKHIIHAGDVYDSRKGQTVVNLNTLEEILDDLTVKMHCIPGNHDKTDYGSSRSFLDPFKYHPNFKLYSEPDTYTEHHDIVLAPFYSEETYIQKIKDQSAKFLITHIGLDGAVMNNGVSLKSKISQSTFDAFSTVLTGHYHDRAMYGKVQYIGASIQHNFGEAPIKGATILYDDGSTELREFSFPKYLAYEIDVTKITQKDLKELQKEREASGDQLRVILKGTDAQIRAFDKQRLQDAGIDVKTKEDKITAEGIQDSVQAFTDKSILSSFKTFCKKNNLEEKEGLKYLKPILC